MRKYFHSRLVGSNQLGRQGDGQQVVPAAGLGLGHRVARPGRGQHPAADRARADRGAVQHPGEADGDHEPRLGVRAAGLHPDRHPRRLLLLHRRAHRRPVDQPRQVGVTYRRTVRSYK